MAKRALARRRRLLGGEPLEPRRLLAAAAFTEPALAIEPGWFATVAGADPGGPALLEANALTAGSPTASLREAKPPREWIVQLSDEAVAGLPDPKAAAAALEAAVPGLQVLRGLGGRGQLLVSADENLSLQLQAAPGVARVEVNGLITPAAFEPNDPDYLIGDQWALENTGQYGGLVDADIDAAAAWEITPGDPGVVIAIIDGGIDISHPDLAPNVWRNPGEIAGNGIDDDGNGFVDDVVGWDFRNGNSSVFDFGDNDHGTLVAGVAAARGGNASGGLGAAPLARFLPLKFIDGSGGSTADAISALNYVTMMRQRGEGIRVANLSWGSGDSSWFLKRAIEDAGAAGVLVVASAGNDGLDQARAFSPNYPSGFDSANILAVAATDRSDRLWSSSNYGLTRVDLAAPGVTILSTAPGRSSALRSGTSFAAPFVAGVAALAATAAPDISVSELREAILAGVDPVPALAGKLASGGRLNAAATLSIVNDPEATGREYLEAAAGELVVVAEPRSGSRQLIIRGPGTVAIAAANQHAGGTRVESGTLVVRDPAALGSGPLEVLAGASVVLEIGSATAAVSELDLAAAGRIDLAAGGLAIARGADEAAVRGAILAGRAAGSWAGQSGITSAVVAATTGTLAVGYAVSDDGSALVMTTLLGDVDLDRDVDLFDLLAIANGGRLNADLPAGWQDGDVDFDGRVNLFDLLVISGSAQYGAGSFGPASETTAAPPSVALPAGPLDPRQQAFARLAMGMSWESVSLTADEDEHAATAALLQ